MSAQKKGRNAIIFMKKMGFAPEKVKPVLKNLLKVYDNNWEFIESDDYSALVEAVLESDELRVDDNQDPPDSEHSAGITIGESSMKKHKTNETPQMHPGQKDKQVSPHSHVENNRNDFISKQSNLPPRNGTPQMHPGQKDKHVSPHADDQQNRNDFISKQSNLPPRNGTLQMHPGQKDKHVSPHSDVQENGNDIISNHTNLHPRSIDTTEMARKRVYERISNTRHLKIPKTEPNTDDKLITPKTEPKINNYLPIAVFPPAGSQFKQAQPNPMASEDKSAEVNDTPMQENGLTSLASRCDAGAEADENNCKIETNLPVANTYDIAASPSGEIKLSLTCDRTLNKKGFHMPDLEAVLKQVEDNCLRSYKLIEPSFSLKMLMQEICKSILELGKDGKASNEEEGYVNISMNGDLLKRYNPYNAPSELLPRVPQVHSNGHALLSCGNKKDNAGTSETQNLAIVQHDHFSFDDVRPLHDVNDISKGEEVVPVPVVNEMSSESCPLSFHYIPKNIVYQSAYVNFSLARIGDEDCCPDCSGDCLSSFIPCACARETGGEYAYTLDGLVKKEFLDCCISMNQEPHKHKRLYCQDCPLERAKNDYMPEPCKGHIVRKFIKECWSKCGCNKQCGNRVVQRGITRNLQVFFTHDGKGWGLRTLDELPRGSFVCEYVGEILTNTELYERNIRSSNEKHTYPVVLDADWGSEAVLKDEEALCLDGTFYGNVARFINHRCYDANLVAIPVEVETPDRHYYHLAFFTTRNVESLEELTWDYGIDFEDVDHPVKAFRCKCGSKECRDVKRPIGRCKRLLSASKPKARVSR